MYIGLTGYLATGKGVVADILKEKEFSYASLSDVVREEATAQGLEHTRENLIKVGNELKVNSLEYGGPKSPSVTGLANGGFVVC